MNTLPRSLLLAGLILNFALLGTAPAAAQAPAAAPDGVVVQARGPIHEAFAQPVSFQPEPGPLVPQAPPPPVPEEPPPQAPEGDNVQWINGYWSWDAEANQFVWVSGVYRNAPPGERFVDGYWEQTPNGWRWVPGFWAPASQAQLPYVPQAPPAPLDANGPSLPPPNENNFYTPGTWLYRNTGYVWQPGYYQPMRPGLVWIPACYAWTPGGYVFVPGYWDYPLNNRGLLFAPVVFNRPLWQTPGWVYRPAYTVGYGSLLNSLFVRPGLRHYYFGDYYGPAYTRLGFSPWYAYGPRYRDPLFNYYRWTNRANPGWAAGLQTTYRARVAGTMPLPPRTLALQSAARGNPIRVVTPLSQVATTGVRVRSVAAPQLAALRTSAVQSRQFAVARSRREAVRVTTPRSLSRPGAARVGPVSPVRTIPAVKTPAALPRVTAPPVRTPARVVQPHPVTVQPRTVVNSPRVSAVRTPAPALHTARPVVHTARPIVAPTHVAAAPRPAAHVVRSSPAPAARAHAAPAHVRPAASHPAHTRH